MQNERAQQCLIWFLSFDAFVHQNNGEVSPLDCKNLVSIFFEKLKNAMKIWQWAVNPSPFWVFPYFIFMAWDAQHPPQQIPDSLSLLRPLHPYCRGGFCTLPSTILHQWAFKVNKLMNFTRGGIGTFPNLSQLLLFWTAWRWEGTSVPNFVLLFMFLISLGYLWLEGVMYLFQCSETAFADLPGFLRWKAPWS